MQWDCITNIVATLILAFVAILAIVIPIIRISREVEKERKKLALEYIIQWSEESLAILAKYTTMYFNQLDDLLVKAHVLIAKRFTVIIRC